MSRELQMTAPLETASYGTVTHSTYMEHRFLSTITDCYMTSGCPVPSCNTGVSTHWRQRLNSPIRLVIAVPPELLASGVLSKAADVYSFGVLMVELWSQSRAWAGAPVCRHWQPDHGVACDDTAWTDVLHAGTCRHVTHTDCGRRRHGQSETSVPCGCASWLGGVSTINPSMVLLRDAQQP